MKKLYLITRTQITVFASVCLVAVAGLIYSSCNSDEDAGENENQYVLKSSISADYYNNLILKLDEPLSTRSTFTAQDEQECKELLAPLVDDGKMIQEELLLQAHEQNAEEDIEFFQNLSDEELASLSFLAYEIEEFNDIFDQNSASISVDQFVTCLAAAYGITDMRRLWKQIILDGAIVGTTIRSALRLVVRHYAGWLGVAFFVYDSYECISKAVDKRERYQNAFTEDTKDFLELEVDEGFCKQDQ